MLKPDGIYCDCCNKKFADLPANKAELLVLIESRCVVLDKGETLDSVMAQIEAVRRIQ